MLSGESIICFSSKEWVPYTKTAKTHLMEIFSKQNKVLYVETVGSRSPGMNTMHLSRIFRRILKWVQGLKHPPELPVDHQLWVYSPIVIPFHQFKWIQKLNFYLFRSTLKKLMKQLGMQNPILWFYLPTPVDMIGQLSEKFVVYHSVDEWATYPGTRNPVFQQKDEMLFRKANVVFCSNRLLIEKKKIFNQNIHYVPHGVNALDFTRAIPGFRPLPEDISQMQRPILGMIGSLSEWIDWDIILYLARRHPEWSIVMIGAIGYDADLNKIQGVKNVHVMGRKNYTDLPQYYRAIDVCLISFRLNEHIKYCCPTRAYEHLAAGKPVVATDFPAIHELDQFVKIARNKEDFENKVIEALKENTPQLSMQRREAALDNTWESRAELMSKLIIERLKKNE